MHRGLETDKQTMDIIVIIWELTKNEELILSLAVLEQCE